MKTSLLLNIQKCCIHDGPGIRTTIFFKGCPLECTWCHNPESQSFNKEIMHNSEKCTNCGECISKCTSNALSFSNNKILLHKQLACTSCETCVDYCKNEALQFAGKEYSISQLIKEIQKDQIFYEESNGGITLSGGEVMSHIDYVEQLCIRCHSLGINITIDTCGYAPYENFKKILPYVDLFLYDIKLIDNKKHLKYTGKSNKLIIDNLKKLSMDKAHILLRLPIIDGINANKEHLKNLCSLVYDLNLDGINILPYHDIGGYKYQSLNKSYDFEKMKVPTSKILNDFKETLENYHSNVKIGG